MSTVIDVTNTLGAETHFHSHTEWRKGSALVCIHVSDLFTHLCVAFNNAPLNLSDNFPRKDREDWGRINAGISSDTYATAISQCESPKRSLFGRRSSKEFSPDHMVRDLTKTLRSSIPDHADELQTRESKLERAKEALPDNLKAKVMEIGGDLYLPMDDDE